MQDTQGTTRTALAGVVFMIAGVSLFPIMNTFAKSLTVEFILWQVIWARFAGHLLVTTFVFLPRRGFALFQTQKPGRQLLRSTIFFGSNVCFIAALPHVSLATASSIMFTAPVLVTLMSVWFLSERIGIWRWSAVLAGFVGAVIIIRPGDNDFNAATLLVLGSAVCYSTYQLLTRSLTTDDAADTQIVYTALVGAVVTTLVVPFVARVPDTLAQVGSFAAIGCLGALGHFLVIEALKRASASVVAPLGYVELVGATALGFFVFGDFPDKYTWIGAGLIVGSGLVIAYRQSRSGREGKGLPRGVTYYLPQFMTGCGVLMMFAALLLGLR